MLECRKHLAGSDREAGACPFHDAEPEGLPVGLGDDGGEPIEPMKARRDGGRATA